MTKVNKPTSALCCVFLSIGFFTCSYGLELFLLSIDEGISGYRDDSLETVKRNELQVFFLAYPSGAHISSRATLIVGRGSANRIGIQYKRGKLGSDTADKIDPPQYGIPLKIVSYKDLYNWTMDEIVAKIGKKNNCTFCGVFRRQVWASQYASLCCCCANQTPWRIHFALDHEVLVSAMPHYAQLPQLRLFPRQMMRRRWIAGPQCWEQISL
jgi:hypothetical protein